MSLWIVAKQRETTPPYRAFYARRPVDRPSWTVAANGIANASHGQWWLEDDGMPDAVTTTVEKPPYRVPPMAEVREIPWNGLNVASTFAGAGGSSTGYRMAGYRVLAAVEFVPAAADTYEANKAPYTRLLRADVRELLAEELLEACGLGEGELDVLDGSPPCEPFSTAGRRDATWNQVREYSGQHQRTDDLFYEFARLVEGVRPRAFAAENVTGLVKGRAKGYFKRIMAALRSCGYRVEARILDAAWLGVPQSRQRVILVGVREDLDRAPAWPVPLPYQYTVRDAIGDLLAGGAARMGSFSRKDHPPVIMDAAAPTVVAGDSTYWHVDEMVGFYRDTRGRNQTQADRDRLDDPCPAIVNGHGNSGHYELEVTGFRHDTGGRFAGPDRDRLDEPCPAVVAGHGNAGTPSGHYQVEFDEQTVGNDAFEPTFGPLDAAHPTVTAEGARTSGELRSSQARVRRRFTIAELRRICGFPDDYVLTGSFSQQWERLGDAVPPPMAAAWARALAAGPLAEGGDR